MFSTEQKVQIEAHGVSVKSVEKQLDNFKGGFPSLPIVRAASIGDGIVQLSKVEIDDYADSYRANCNSLNVVKFVPASGAATRMFKELYEFVEQGKRSSGVEKVLSDIEKFAFYPELKSLLKDGATEKGIISAIIGEGLNYGSVPKGMVTFHRYDDEVRKAAEEHLVEGAQYAAADGKVRIHFTISAEHKPLFEGLFKECLPRYEAKYGVKYEINYSVQMPSTDTVAVTPENELFLDDSGKLLFRPAGHGALIENLNQIDADLIFVKTVDNVTTDSRRGDTILYKEALAGLLLDTQSKMRQFSQELKDGVGDKAQIAEFVECGLAVKLPADYTSELLAEILNRPLRVCGMVRNEGEPGGGPFWVRANDGTESLQIAESSQIAPEDMEIMRTATHFNPVDIICAVRKGDGSKYNLPDFVDATTGFISSKSYAGRALKAQELPGLWNGAMAKWNTLFVEVPITTFSPVKVVEDLLRAEHQQGK